MSNYQEITYQDFILLRSEFQESPILDVREAIEFHTFNIGGENISLGKLAQVLENDDLSFEKDDNIVVICQHGIRSKTAQIMLQNAGYTHVKNLKGGLINFIKHTHKSLEE